MGDTALMLACSSGLADVALKLIEGGAYVHAIMEVHAVFVGAHTALMPACSMGLADVVKALLVHGAGANVTHNHTTLMEIALRSRDPESVQNILKGQNPRVITEVLSSYLPPAQRAILKAED